MEVKKKNSPSARRGSQLEETVISKPILEDTTNQEKSQDSDNLRLNELEIETVEGGESGLSQRTEIDASNSALFLNRLINALVDYQEDGFEDSPTARLVNWGNEVLNKLNTLTEGIKALTEAIKEASLKVSGDGHKRKVLLPHKGRKI